MAEVKKFPQSPYFDDFNEENNFLRILFRPGITVQTRELNQLQTILQDQIGIISDFAISNNSRVIGGETNLVKDFPFIILSGSATLSREIDSYEDATFVANNGVSGKIQFVIPASGADATTFYVNYETASTDGLSQVPADNSLLTITFSDNSTETVSLKTVDATGNSAAVILNEGIFYYNKTFVRTDRQLLLLSKYSADFTNQSFSVGFYISDSIVKPETDISLLDNCTGSPNESAPGAHRYKSTLVLSLASDLTEEQLIGFTELLRIVNGEVAAKPRIDNEFAVLEQILARRTYDESGDYIVNDFIVDVREHLQVNDNGGVYTANEGGDETKFVMKFDDGLAYIRGYEVRTTGDNLLEVPKARTTASAQNAIIQTQFANALFCYDVVGHPILSAKLRLKNSSNTVIGTAFVRGFEYNSQQVIASVTKSVYRLDLVNVSFLSGGSWSAVAKVDYDPSVSATYQFSANVNSFETNAAEGSLVYALPYGFSQSIDPQVSFFYKEISTTSVNASVTISTGTSVESFDDEVASFFVFADYTTGKVGIPASVTVIDSQNVSLNISNIVGTSTPGNVPVRIIAKTFCSAPVVRNKTLVESFVNTGLTPANVVVLTKADAYKLKSVVTSGGVDVTDSYTLDTGARDTYYDFASLVLKSGEPVPAGPLTVEFSYFEHGPSGDFFAPTSYSGVQYNNIPYYTTSTGKKIFLGSAVDYRQRRTSSNNLEKVGRHAFVTDDQLITDITYYMGRTDRVMLTKAGEFILLTGTPSLTPQLPNEIPDAITLYTMAIPPYTFTTKDVVAVKVDHRRYTMRDIGKLETRIANVEEVALLTSLERDVIMEDFDGRFKSGFIVDNFSNNNVQDFASTDFKAALDAQNSEVRPMNVCTFIDVDNIDGTNTNIKIHDNGATTLNYTLTPFAEQMFASTVVRLQPYISYNWIGDMVMTPASDIWFETQSEINTNIFRTQNLVRPWDGSTLATFVENTSTSSTPFDASLLAGNWNLSNGAWRNDSTGALASADEIAGLQVIVRDRGTTTANVSVSSTTSTSQIAIPFIRSRAVRFDATGLKPGVKLYASFDGVDVSKYITAVGGSAPSGTPGWNTNSGVSDPLVVSPNGSISGTFFIPANTFRTGSRLFKLSDSPDPKSDFESNVAVFTYSATGTLIREVTTITATQVNNKVTPWTDPVAQSFLVDESALSGGVFVAAVDLYFGSFTRNIHDVNVEIRRMVNGYPAGEAIAAHAKARRAAADIVGSTDGSAATRFTFISPVYLPAGEEYAFVVLSASETMTIWCAETGKRSYKAGDTVSPTGQVISKQPYLGSMFLSQNSKTWTADQLKDIKFKLHRCEFVSSGSVDFINTIDTINEKSQSNIHERKLLNNPLYFTNGSTEVFVSGWGHGFSVGDTFELQNAEATGSYFSIPVTEIYNTPLTVTYADVFGFKFNVTTPAGSSGRQGGNAVYVKGWAIDFSVAQLLSDAAVVDGTSLKYTMSNRRKAAYSSGNVGSVDLVPDSLVNLGEMFVIKASFDGGVKLHLDMTTNKNNISPIVYSDRLGVNVYSNVINDIKLLNDVGIRQDKASPARYVQKQVSLVNPANELRVYVDANLPAGTTINAYYKVGQTSIQGEWVKMSQAGSLVYSDDPSKFYTQKFIQNFDNEFQVFSVLIEFISSNKARVPRLGNYRALALNV